MRRDLVLFKVLLRHCVHVRLVVLEAEHVIGTMLVQLPGDVFLTVDGDDLRRDLVAFFLDRVGEHLARLVAFDDDPARGQVHLDQRFGIDFAHGVHHRAFAVAAGHTRDLKSVLHGNPPLAGCGCSIMSAFHRAFMP
jgi:hypothetical protein